ncbi:U-box domain-containing protein 52-like [Vitis riparia]|uniref:U-box domain-containing protein 52-like n=1 Tax=Vitis riparia TaxID=96939 RepID=UPI00155A3A5F|nr:U-box domain-containing protein 52-like [Vitis riparia]XP_034699940.1 U-box domain-containing protein 52-like [Vitis riparia]
MSRTGYGEKKVEVAVAIDKDKGSQYALKWAVDHLLSKGQSVTLLHIKQKASSIPNPLGNQVAISDVNEDVARAYKQQLDNQARELFLPFRCFCTRKDIQCNEVILEDTDITKAIINFVTASSIEILVVGAPSRSGFIRRFKTTDVPSSVLKAAPDFCTVYVISKGKITSVRSATRPVPNPSPPPTASSLHQNQASPTPDPTEAHLKHNRSTRASERSSFGLHNLNNLEIKSPFTRGRASLSKSYGELSVPETDISFVSSGRPSIDRIFPFSYDNLDTGMNPRLSNSSEMNPRLSNSSDLNTRLSIGSEMNPRLSNSSDLNTRLSNGSELDCRSFASSGGRSSELNYSLDLSSSSNESGRLSWASQSMEDVEAEMRRLKLELKQTMDMYSTACKEALSAKQTARELHRWKMEEAQRLGEARLAEEAALATAEREKAKAKAALEAAEASQRIAKLEAQKRINAEMVAIKEAEERKKMLDTLAQTDLRYRKYTIEEIEAATELFSESRKIGEGGYGPVYKSYLDHTPVAIKVLRPDAAQGRSQFQQEVEVLSCIRHPNMVLLLGACPEYGCLVYEYMANGSLDDHLFRRGNTPVLPWQLRFQIAAEIGTGLLFLHQTKPEPLVHRDLKPGNILLDRNFVSKISDVGLARLVPPSVADSVTQYLMTSTAGTFCYIDPEYQQTGMLGTKSDIYSLGIMLLQIITAKPPMGLTHYVERAIEKGTFAEVLDPAVHDWPVEEALKFAKLALQCAELRRKDRPDLGNVVLPELNRLRTLAEENMSSIMLDSTTVASPRVQEVMSNPQLTLSGYISSRGRSSISSMTERM